MEQNLTEAAEQVSLVIRNLRARLWEKPSEPETASEITPESPEDLERQLADYFARSMGSHKNGALADLRNRVVDSVADRILKQWEAGTPLESAVLDRLIDRIASRFSTSPR